MRGVADSQEPIVLTNTPEALNLLMVIDDVRARIQARKHAEQKREDAA